MKNIKSLYINLSQFLILDLNDFRIDVLILNEIQSSFRFVIPNKDLQDDVIIKDFTGIEDKTKQFIFKKNTKQLFDQIGGYRTYYSYIVYSFLAYLTVRNKIDSLTTDQYNELISQSPRFAAYLILFKKNNPETVQRLEDIILDDLDLSLEYATRYKNGPWEKLEKTKRYRENDYYNKTYKMNYLKNNLIDYNLNKGKTLDEILNEMIKDNSYRNDLDYIFSTSKDYLLIVIQKLFDKKYFKSLDDYLYNNHLEIYGKFYSLLRDEEIGGDYNLPEIRKRVFTRYESLINAINIGNYDTRDVQEFIKNQKKIESDVIKDPEAIVKYLGFLISYRKNLAKEFFKDNLPVITVKINKELKNDFLLLKFLEYLEDLVYIHPKFEVAINEKERTAHRKKQFKEIMEKQFSDFIEKFSKFPSTVLHYAVLTGSQFKEGEKTIRDNPEDWAKYQKILTIHN